MQPIAGGLQLYRTACQPRSVVSLRQEGSGRLPGCGLASRPQRRRRRQASLPGDTVPDVPITGDDQGSTIYTAVSHVPTSSDEEDNIVAAAGALSAAAPLQRGGVPHRWQVVGMMALAFVCCNMDKVKGGHRGLGACTRAASSRRCAGRGPATGAAQSARRCAARHVCRRSTCPWR
jgi:hypothetical protein